MKNKNIWIYGFNWGSIIGGAFFFYRILGYSMNLEMSFFWSFIGSFIVVFGMGWSMVNYRKNIVKTNLKFGRYFSIGAIMSIFISLFTTLFMMVYIWKLNPIYLDNFLVQMQEIYDQMGYGIEIYDNPNIYKMVKIVFFPSTFIFDYIGNLFYVLIVSMVISRPMMGQAMMQNRPNPNDYVPYKDINKEEEEIKEIEDEIEEEDNNNEKDNN